MIIKVRGKTPILGKDVFVAPTATLIGDVTIGDQSSIWFGAILRGDVHSIELGKKCNIQDGTIIHCTYKKWNTVLEDDVSVGHGVIIHGCRIGRGSLIGMGSVIMDGAHVGAESLVGAGSLVTEGTK